MLAKPVLMKYPCQSAESPCSAMAMADQPDAGPQPFGGDDDDLLVGLRGWNGVEQSGPSGGHVRQCGRRLLIDELPTRMQRWI